MLIRNTLLSLLFVGMASVVTSASASEQVMPAPIPVKIPYGDHYGIDHGLFVAAINGKWGVFDKSGKPILSPTFEEMSSFWGGVARVKQNGQWGLMSTNLSWIVKPQFEDIFAYFSEGLTMAKSNGKWGYINQTGSYIIPPRFKSNYGQFLNGYAAVETEDGVGIINRNGDFIVSPTHKFKHIHRIPGSPLALVKLDENKYNFIDVANYDRTKTFVMEREFYYYAAADENGVSRVQVSANGEWGLLNPAGEWIIFPNHDYDYIDEIKSGAYMVKSHDQCGYINNNGKVIVPPILSWCEKFSEGLAGVKPHKNGGYGYISKTGEMAIKANFEFVEPFSEGLAAVDKGGKCGYINKSGKFAIPPHFAQCQSFHEGYAEVSLPANQSDRSAFIDRAGHIVIMQDLLQNN